MSTAAAQQLTDGSVDPNVRIPGHVTKAAKAAEELFKQVYEQPAEQPTEAAAASPPQDPTPAEPTKTEVQQVQPQATPPAEPPKEENVSAEDWRHRFLSMQGRFHKAQQTIGSMEQQMTELGQELMKTQRLVAQLQANPQPAAQPVNHGASQVHHNNLITDEDRANYGDELIDLARRAAMSSLAPELEALRRQNETLTKQVKSTAKRELFAKLDQAMPTWRQINDDTRFKTWLRLPNIYTGQIRQEMLNAAVNGAHAPQVLQFFKDFLTEAQATGQMAPAQPVEPQPQAAPRQPAVSLESLAAPGRARPATGESSLPSDKPIYSRADISKLYRDKQRGLYAGRETEFAQIEADLGRAQVEGRIRG